MKEGRKGREGGRKEVGGEGRKEGGRKEVGKGNTELWTRPLAKCSKDM